MRTTLLFVTFVALAACKKDEKGQEPAPTPTPTPTRGSGTAAAAAQPIIVAGAGLATPESVLYVADDDVYLVSNINGDPAGADDNGFISKLTPDGNVAELKWIDGAKPDVKLDAPKGTAVSGGTLWVADITVVRKFDAKSGAPTGEVPIPGATFVNDVTPDGAGGVYVTDTGVDAKFQPVGADAVYRIAADGKLTTLAKDKALGGPNGVWAQGDAVWVASGAGELYRVTADGKREDVTRLPKGGLDGLVGLDGGDVLVSSWEGAAVYRGKAGGEWKEVAGGIKSPADIGYDTRRKALLIPKFQENEVVIQPLP